MLLFWTTGPCSLSWRNTIKKGELCGYKSFDRDSFEIVQAYIYVMLAAFLTPPDNFDVFVRRMWVKNNICLMLAAKMWSGYYRITRAGLTGI